MSTLPGPDGARRYNVDPEQLRHIFLERLGLRIGPEMTRYVLRRIESGHDSPVPLGAFPVMGGDARTGAPVRRVVDLSVVQGDGPNPRR